MNDIWPADMRDYAALWRHEHAAWLSEISRWQAEHQAIMVDLDHLQEYVQNSGNNLRKHADAIVAHGQTLAEHVQRVSKCHSRGERYDETVSRHRQLAREHAEQHDGHERLKKHHHTVAAQVGMLMNAIAEVP